MRIKKILGLLLILGLMAAVMMGCAGSEPNEQQPEQTPPSQSEEIADPEPEEDVIQGTAVYTGRIDNNSVEMDMQGTPQAFQLTEELMETWDSMGFETGDQLEIQYQERENDRPILLEADKRQARTSSS